MANMYKRVARTILHWASLHLVRHKKKPLRNPGKFVVFMLTHIGDAVLNRFIVDSLSQDPSVESIHLVLKPPVDQIFFEHPGISKIHVFSCPWVGAGTWMGNLKSWLKLISLLRKEKFDVAMVTHPHVLTSLTTYLCAAKQSWGWAASCDHFLDYALPHDQFFFHAQEYGKYLLAMMDIPIVKSPNALQVHRDHFNQGCKLLDEVQARERKPLGRIIAVHPGAGGEAKIWPKENFASALRQAAGNNDIILLLGHSKEESLCRWLDDALSRKFRMINFCGRLNLGELAGVLSKSNMYLGNDSGPSHMAAAVGAPSLVIFGPCSDPAVWAPRGPEVVTLRFNKNEFFSGHSAKAVANAMQRLLAEGDESTLSAAT